MSENIQFERLSSLAAARAAIAKATDQEVEQ